MLVVCERGWNIKQIMCWPVVAGVWSWLWLSLVLSTGCALLGCGRGMALVVAAVVEVLAYCWVLEQSTQHHVLWWCSSVNMFLLSLDANWCLWSVVCGVLL